MSRDLTPSDWLAEIEHGIAYRREYGIEDFWPDLEDLFFNVHASQMHQGPNILMTTGDALMSSLNVPDAYLSVTPRRLDTVNKAPLIENVLNTILDDIDIEEEMDYASLNAYLFGAGFLKIGYDSEWGYNPTKGPEGFGLTFTQFDKQGRRIEFNDYRPGMPWVRSVSPHDIVLPWGTRDMKDAAWVAHRVVRHIDDLKADPKYINRTDLKPNTSIEEYTRSYSRQMTFSPPGDLLSSTVHRGTESGKYVQFWEIHERRTHRVKCVVPELKKFIRDDLDLMQVGGLPFVHIGFNPRHRHIWTSPPAFYLIASQSELSDISLQASKQRRISILRLAVDGGAFDEDELDKLLTSDVGAVIKAKQGQDVSRAVTRLPDSNNNFSLYNDAAIIERNMQKLIGFGSNQFGEFDSSSRRTATEAAVVDQSSKQRLGRRAKILAKAYERTGFKILEIVKNYWRVPRIASVLAPNGAQMFQEYVGQDLRGEISFKTSFSEPPADNVNARRSLAIQMFSALRGDPNVDQNRLYNYLLNRFNDIDFASIFTGDAQNGPEVPQTPVSEVPSSGQGLAGTPQGNRSGVPAVSGGDG